MARRPERGDQDCKSRPTGCADFLLVEPDLVTSEEGVQDAVLSQHPGPVEHDTAVGRHAARALQILGLATGQSRLEEKLIVFRNDTRCAKPVDPVPIRSPQPPPPVRLSNGHEREEPEKACEIQPTSGEDGCVSV